MPPWAWGRDRGCRRNFRVDARARDGERSASTGGQPAKGSQQGPEMGTIPRPDSSKSGPPSQIPYRFVPTFHPHAMLGLLPLPDGSRTFRCRWEGMPLDQARKRQRASREEAMANAVPLAAHFPSGIVREPATGPSSVSCLRAGAGHRSRACGGHGVFCARVRAGTRAQSISRGSSELRPGQPGRRALKRGR